MEMIASLVDISGDSPGGITETSYLVFTTTFHPAPTPSTPSTAAPSRPGINPLASHLGSTTTTTTTTTVTTTAPGARSHASSNSSSSTLHHFNRKSTHEDDKKSTASKAAGVVGSGSSVPKGYLEERQARKEARKAEGAGGGVRRRGKSAGKRREGGRATRGSALAASPDREDDDGDFEMGEPVQQQGSGSPSTDNDLTPGVSPSSQLDDPLASHSVGNFQSPHLGIIDENFRNCMNATPMGRLILAREWDTTPLGPIETWSPTLRSMVCLAIETPYRTSLLWGKECVMLYNDEYIKTAGNKHPRLLGLAGAEGWAEIWKDLGPKAEKVLEGEPYTVYDSLLFINRDPGNVKGIHNEECYYSFSWIPVRGPDGERGGDIRWNIAWETSMRVIAERRLATTRSFTQITMMSRTKKDFCKGALEAIEQNPYDLPFVILYTCETKKNSRKNFGGDFTEEDDSATCSSGNTSSSCNKLQIQLNLAGTVGVPAGHPSTPTTVDLTIHLGSDHTSTASLVAEGQSGGASSSTSQATVTSEFKGEEEVGHWPLHEACALGKPIYIPNLGSRASGVETRGWGDMPRAAVVIPVTTSDDSTAPLAVIVFGLSPRLYWTEAYGLFLNMLARHFYTGLSTVIGHEEEAKRLEDMAALDRAKTTFFSNISHELRTPLTLIVGPVSDILSANGTDAVNPAVKERLKIVKRNTQRIINLVNQLLDLSRFEAGRMHAKFRATDLPKTIADLASLFRSAMIKNKIEYTVECPPSNHRVWIDADLLEKLVFNLCSNAMKFTPAGGRVLVRVLHDSTRAYFVISDSGVGISKSDLPRIFDRFHRIEHAARQAEGTGIGLALVQDIIKLHDGALNVDSEPGRGTVFKCIFQLGTAHLPEDQLDHTPQEELDRANDMVVASDARRWMLGELEGSSMSVVPAMSPAASDSSGSGSRSSWDPTHRPVGTSSEEEDVLSTRGSTIVLVDDNEDMRLYVSSLLGKYFTVQEFASAIDALSWVKNNKADLVLTDVMMPKMNGFELLKRLKGSASTAHISVVLLSARAGSEARVEGLAAGADAYLVKPFQAKELLAQCNAALQVAKIRQRLERAVEERTRDLVKSEIMYRTLAQSMEAITMLSPVGIVKFDPFGALIFANTAFLRQSGVHSAAPLENWQRRVHADDVQLLTPAMSEIFRDRGSGFGEFRWLDSTWCSWELNAYFGDDGTLIGFLGCMTDVTERKKGERQQIDAAEQRARDALEAKRQHTEFVDMASHELRNPLSGVMQAAELLSASLRSLLVMVTRGPTLSPEDMRNLRSELEEDIDAVESIQTCSNQQLRIADDIINVSKLSMGLLMMQRIDFNLLDRVREVISMYWIGAQRKGIELKIEAGEALQHGPQYVNADPNRLAQVMINFLGNSMRYTALSDNVKRVTVHANVLKSVPPVQPGSRRIGEIKPEIANAGDDLIYVYIGITDTGMGLSPTELGLLFNRFSQANPTVDYGGQGLGLYISAHLVSLHGGFIDVLSTKGVGSTFSFVIPAKQGLASMQAEDIRPGMGKRMISHSASSPQPSPAPQMRSAASLMASAAGPVSPIVGSPPQGPSKFTGSSGGAPMVESPPPTEPMQGLTVSVAARLTPKASAGAVVGSGCHVLIVEDNVINVKVLKRQLTLKGYTVSVAMDGRQGLDMLYADADGTRTTKGDKTDVRIEMVLMDIQMPVMGGEEAIAELRASEKAGKITKRYPVIAVTGNARREQVEHFLAIGFDEICVKPYKIEVVQERIEDLLADSRKRIAEGRP